MYRPKKFLSYVAGLLVMLTAATAIVLAAKPGPKPPPPPPSPSPIVFDLHLLGIFAQPRCMNDAGDMTFRNSILIAGTTTPVDPNLFLQDPNWVIKNIAVINNNSQVACRAQFMGDTDEASGLTQGREYIGLLNCADGSFTRLFEPIAGVTIQDINDEGMICGQIVYQGYWAAFVAGPAENSGIEFLFPEDAGFAPSWAMGVNNHGEVVGRRGNFGYRLSPPADPSGEPNLLMLGKIQDGKNISDFNMARDINDAGEFAGYANGPASVKGFGASGYKAYRYEDGVGMIQLSTSDAVTTSITQGGDILGYFDWTSPSEHFIHLRSSNELVKLRSSGVIQGAAADLGRWTNETTYVNGMNNNRVIYGYFYNDQQAFVLVPRP